VGSVRLCACNEGLSANCLSDFKSWYTKCLSHIGTGISSIKSLEVVVFQNTMLAMLYCQISPMGWACVG
jgi:hypothetical protein